MLFTWHDDKAVSNRRKHGVAFADAAQVFNDPFAVAGHGRIESGERRWQIVGLIVVVVAYTLEESGEHEIIRLISAGKQREGKESTMSKIVRKTLNERKPSARRKRELAELASRADHEINLSDIPELTNKFWQSALPNPFYRPVKKQVTLRLDADVLAWLRKQGKGYQTRANFLLRQMMIRDR